jgi:mannose-6-phosphate isomerase-like protein (cupin superfamily)
VVIIATALKGERAMNKSVPVNVGAAFRGLRFLAERTPESAERGPQDYYARVADYRNGGVFVSHFAGTGEWERHPHGDELVMVMEGEADLFLIQDGKERRESLKAGELIVVPENTWHRFETSGVKIMTVTPRPTDHRRERPE